MSNKQGQAGVQNTICKGRPLTAWILYKHKKEHRGRDALFWLPLLDSNQRPFG